MSVSLKSGRVDERFILAVDTRLKDLVAAEIANRDSVADATIGFGLAGKGETRTAAAHFDGDGVAALNILGPVDLVEVDLGAGVDETSGHAADDLIDGGGKIGRSGKAAAGFNTDLIRRDRAAGLDRLRGNQPGQTGGDQDMGPNGEMLIGAIHHVAAPGNRDGGVRQSGRAEVLAAKFDAAARHRVQAGLDDLNPGFRKGKSV